MMHGRKNNNVIGVIKCVGGGMWSEEGKGK